MPAATRFRCLCVAVAAAAFGCTRGPSYPREPISGTVTLDGKPLVKGTITLEPKAQLPTQVIWKVTGGEFNIPKEAGPVPGKYAVIIVGGPVDPDAAAKFEGGAVSPNDPIYQKLKEMVPAHYNTKTTLEVDVRAQEPNEFRFDLSSASNRPMP